MASKESAAACLLFLLAHLFPSSQAFAQNFEVQVYGSETVAPLHTMLESHTNMALRGTTHTVDGVLPTQYALHETIEITQGFTSWFETGFYLFTSWQSADGFQWVGDHIRPRVRAPESWEWPVGASLSLEFGYQRREFSTDTWTLEIRPIIDKEMGPWYISFNPTLDLSFKGQNSNKGPEFAPNLKISYAFTELISGGIEYYGALGPLKGFDPLKQQEHLLFSVIDLDLGPEWEFNFGVGFGLTPATDRLLVKMILGYRFDFFNARGKNKTASSAPIHPLFLSRSLPNSRL
jgi:hypothetical protein